MRENALKRLCSASKFQNDEKKFKVGILVFTYNQEEYLAECLKSIFSQQFHSFRVIVLDDKSTDETLKIAKYFSTTYPDKIQILVSEENYGNVKESFKKKSHLITVDFEYFVVIEGDDLFGDPCRIAKQVESLDSNSNLIGVSSNCYLWKTSDDSTSLIKPDLEIWNYLDTVKLVNQYSLYVHLSSVMWKHASRTSLFPKKYLKGKTIYGEAFFSVAMLRENRRKSLKHLELHGSTYRYTGKGIWSSLSSKQQAEENLKLNRQLDSLKPLFFRNFRTKI